VTEVANLQRLTLAGAGNALIAHDRIGPAVIDAFRACPLDDLEVVELRGGGLGLLDVLRGQDALIVVDACATGGAPGAQREVELPELLATPQPPQGMSLHQIGPLEALQVAAELYPERMPRRVILLLVETEGLDEAGEVLARNAVTARVTDLAAEVLARPAAPDERLEAPLGAEGRQA
jgi:hydrogenase maturation protease